jgi:hypothetical protein
MRALPQQRKRALKEQCDASLQVRSALDHVKFKGNSCMRCKRPTHPGERAFFYPEDRSLYCDGEDCGQAANRELSARAFDEDNNTSM